MLGGWKKKEKRKEKKSMARIYFWIHFTCGFDIRVYLGHWCPFTGVKGLKMVKRRSNFSSLERCFDEFLHCYSTRNRPYTNIVQIVSPTESVEVEKKHKYNEKNNVKHTKIFCSTGLLLPFSAARILVLVNIRGKMRVVF